MAYAWWYAWRMPLPDLPILLARVPVGVGFTMLGLQLFTGPDTLSEFAWASFFFCGGVFVLAVLASFPSVARPRLDQLWSTFFSVGKTAEDSDRRSRSYGRLSWLILASASMWLLFWVFVVARTSLSIYHGSVVPVFSCALGLSFAMLAWSIGLRLISLTRRAPRK